jgi:hypothetical protein
MWHEENILNIGEKCKVHLAGERTIPHPMRPCAPAPPQQKDWPLKTRYAHNSKMQ